MGVRIYIHRIHREHTEGKDILEVNGNTVGECIAELIALHPGIRNVILEHDGKLRNSLEIYVNLKNAHPHEMETPVQDGDRIHIALLLVGG